MYVALLGALHVLLVSYICEWEIDFKRIASVRDRIHTTLQRTSQLRHDYDLVVIARTISGGAHAVSFEHIRRKNGVRCEEVCICPLYTFDNRHRRFDIYRKVPKDLTQPTLTGAIISIGCVLFILFLFLSELYAFLSVEV